MKKLLFLLVCLLCFCLLSCGDLSNTDLPKDPVCSSCGTQVSNENELCVECTKLNLYKKFLGVWDAIDPLSVTDEIFKYGRECYYTVVFEENSISFDDKKFNFNPKLDIFLEDEVPEPFRLSGKTFYLRVNNRWYPVFHNDYSQDGYDFFYPDNSIKISYWFIDFDNGGIDNCLYTTYIRRDDSISNDNENTNNSTLIDGNYNFENANGSQRNGTLLLENGNWSWSGSGNPAATSGTYSVDGNKITFNWSSYGYDVSETITVTTSGNISTWSSDGVTFFSMLFNVVDSEMTFSYSE